MYKIAGTLICIVCLMASGCGASSTTTTQAAPQQLTPPGVVYQSPPFTRESAARLYRRLRYTAAQYCSEKAILDRPSTSVHPIDNLAAQERVMYRIYARYYNRRIKLLAHKGNLPENAPSLAQMMRRAC